MANRLILAEMAHTDDEWLLQTQATKRLLTSFYDSGVADHSLYTDAAMDFHVSPGFPMLAQIILGVGLLIVAAVLAAIWFVAKRVRRHMVRRQAVEMRREVAG